MGGDGTGRGGGFDPYQRQQGVEAALGPGAGVGVVTAAVGPVEAVGQRLDQVLELRARHLVELGDAGDHPALARGEQQRPVATLPNVQALQIVAGLTAADPIPGLTGSHIGGQGLRLSQQAGIPVDGLGRGLGGGPGQRRGVLSGQASRRQGLGDVGHLPESLGPPGAVLGLPRRAARLPAQRLGGAGLAGSEPPQPDRHPSLQPVEHGPSRADLPGQDTQAGPVQASHVNGLHRSLEAIPHRCHPAQTP